MLQAFGDQRIHETKEKNRMRLGGLSAFSIIFPLICNMTFHVCPAANQKPVTRKKTPSMARCRHANPQLGSPARTLSMNLLLAQPQPQTHIRHLTCSELQSGIWMHTYLQPAKERKGRGGTASKQSDWRRGTGGSRRVFLSVKWGAGGTPWN